MTFWTSNTSRKKGTVDSKDLRNSKSLSIYCLGCVVGEPAPITEVVKTTRDLKGVTFVLRWTKDDEERIFPPGTFVYKTNVGSKDTYVLCVT